MLPGLCQGCKTQRQRVRKWDLKGEGSAQQEQPDKTLPMQNDRVFDCQARATFTHKKIKANSTQKAAMSP